MNYSKFIQGYWNQYMLIEKEFLKTSLYVTIGNDNFSTYSNAYLKIIVQTGAEIDNVFKEICGLSGKKTIGDYVSPILSKYSTLTTSSVRIQNSNITIHPFQGWDIKQPSKSLEWWDKYNSIKHERTLNFKMASLSTSIHILGALFILLMYRLNEIYQLDLSAFTNYPEENESELFILDGWNIHFRSELMNSPYPIIDDSKSEELI